MNSYSFSNAIPKNLAAYKDKIGHFRTRYSDITTELESWTGSLSQLSKGDKLGRNRNVDVIISRAADTIQKVKYLEDEVALGRQSIPNILRRPFDECLLPYKSKFRQQVKFYQEVESRIKNQLQKDIKQKQADKKIKMMENMKEMMKNMSMEIEQIQKMQENGMRETYEKFEENQAMMKQMFTEVEKCKSVVEKIEEKVKKDKTIMERTRKLLSNLSRLKDTISWTGRVIGALGFGGGIAVGIISFGILAINKKLEKNQPMSKTIMERAMEYLPNLSILNYFISWIGPVVKGVAGALVLVGRIPGKIFASGSK